MNQKNLKVNVVLNTIRQLLSLLFPLITVPYVSRHLGVNSYGSINFSMSIVSYFSYFAAMGISTYAIREGSMIRNSQKELDNLCSQLFSLNIFFTILSFILLTIVLVFSVQLKPYKIYIIILSLSILFTTLGVEWINQIFEDYLFLTVRYIVFQVLSIILLFIYVKTSNDIVAYCVIMVIATAGASILNLLHIKKYSAISITINVNFRKHISPLLVFFFSSLAGVIYVNADVTMIGLYYSNSDVGIYVFASKIYNMIKALIYTLISTSIPRITHLFINNKEKYLKYTKLIHTFLSLILIPSVVGMIVVARDVIEILGGKEYVDSKIVLQVLAISIPFAIFGAFYSSFILIINKKADVMLFSTVVAAIINIGINIFLLPIVGIIGAALTTVMAEMCNYIISVLYCKKYFIEYTVFDKKPIFISSVYSIFIILIGSCISFFIAKTGFLMSIVRLTIIIIISVSIYIVIIYKSNNKSIKKVLHQILPQKLK